MKFGQLIVCNMRKKFFCKNYTQNMMVKLILDSFIKNQKRADL